VEDLDGQILASLSEHFHLFLAHDLAGAVVGIDDMVAELELDVFDFDCDLDLLVELLFGDCLGNGVLLGLGQPLRAAVLGQVCR
jgi:hypothetical protein